VSVSVKKYGYNIREQNARELSDGTANYFCVKEKISTVCESH